jgi:hypothetical protein
MRSRKVSVRPSALAESGPHCPASYSVGSIETVLVSNALGLISSQQIMTSPVCACYRRLRPDLVVSCAPDSRIYSSPRAGPGWMDDRGIANLPLRIVREEERISSIGVAPLFAVRLVLVLVLVSSREERGLHS